MKTNSTDYQSLIKSFIEDYNAKTEEINDEFGGIFDEEDEEGIEQISQWFDADRTIVKQESILMEIWNELVKMSGLETIVPTFVIYS